MFTIHALIVPKVTILNVRIKSQAGAEDFYAKDVPNSDVIASVSLTYTHGSLLDHSPISYSDH